MFSSRSARIFTGLVVGAGLVLALSFSKWVFEGTLSSGRPSVNQSQVHSSERASVPVDVSELQQSAQSEPENEVQAEDAEAQPSKPAPEAQDEPEAKSQEQTFAEAFRERVGDAAGLLNFSFGRVQFTLGDDTLSAKEDILSVLDMEPFASREWEVVLRQEMLTNEALEVLVAIQPEFLSMRCNYMEHQEFYALTSIPGVESLTLRPSAARDINPESFAGLNSEYLEALALAEVYFLEEQAEETVLKYPRLESLRFEQCTNVFRLLDAISPKDVLKSVEFVRAGRLQLQTLESLSKFSGVEVLVLDASALGSIAPSGGIIGQGQEDPLRMLGRLSQLTTLRLQGCFKLWDSDFAFLAQLNALRELTVSDGGMKFQGEALEYLANLSSLKSLRFSDCMSLRPEGISKLQDVPGLERLEISNCQHVNRGVSALALPNSLRELTLAQGGGKGFPKIPALDSLEHLESLSLQTLGAFDAELFAQIAKRKTLQVLELDGTGITDLALQELSSLDQLQELKLRADQLSLVGLSYLLSLDSLKELELSRVSPELARDLLGSAAQHSLEELVLRGSGRLGLPIDDGGVNVPFRYLRLEGFSVYAADAAPPASANTPASLHLHECEVQSADAFFARLALTQSLKVLSLRKSKGFNEQNLTQLLQLPSLRLLLFAKWDEAITANLRAQLRKRFPMLEIRID